jgi:methionine aminopeptidase
MHYGTWFMPDIEIVEPDSNQGHDLSLKRKTIQYGDQLHVDFGVTALGLNTDTQHLAYVLYPGQSVEDIPQGFIDGLKKANRMQDIVKSNMKVGSTGNEILKACRDQMKEEGIEGRIYSHAIGDWGHSAGTLIGMRFKLPHVV